MKGNIITPCTFLTDFGCKELKKELVIIWIVSGYENI